MVFHPVDVSLIVIFIHDVGSLLNLSESEIKDHSQASHDVQGSRTRLAMHSRPSALSFAGVHPTSLPSTQVNLGNVNSVIFRQSAQATAGKKFLSLFPGLGYAAGYKVAQRVYKFGGQPYFRDLIAKHDGGFFFRTFGEKKGKMLREAAAGSWVPSSLWVSTALLD